jgi:L-2-hydroxycarboxylate dehydrogenase (NAD+)
VRFQVSRLHDLIAGILTHVGVLAEHADVTASRLLEADLSGRNGHGMIRVPQYVKRIEGGGINLRPQIAVTRPTPVSALIDGDNGLGQVVMTLAVETAIEKALDSGIAWVGTVRSNHAGAAGVYTGIAMRRDLIAMYLAVASANVMPPPGGSDRLLGTNPISIAIPAGEETGFNLDIATTVASHGTISVLAQRGATMPEGWVVDQDGRPITDPRRADDGFLVPIGGYKGAGLNLAIGLLAGVLNHAAFGSDVVDHRVVLDRAANTGQSILVMRPDLFGDLGGFKTGVDRAIGELRASGEPGDVHIPGDRSSRLRAEQEVMGIPVPDALLTDLRDLARRFQMDDDLSE